METIPKKIILFDGICNLCNSSVDFIIDHDIKRLYQFASLQSKVGQEYLQRFNLPLDDFDTFILVEKNEYYTSSTAALRVLKNLSGPIKVLYPLVYFPKPLRDFLYRLVSRNRYSIFGKRDTCRVENDKDKSRFLS